MKFTTLRRVAPATGTRSLTAAGTRRRPAMRAGTILAAGTLAALGLAACGSSSSGGSSAGGSSSSGASGSKLTVADVAPFSGADAALGPTYLASCYGATAAINQAGGVLGHTLTCKSVDTRGDPADAVPAVNQMFASTPGLALVIGCTSDEAASVAPVINAHKMAMFCMTGQSEFDHVHYPYFYRLVPPDLEESYAMAAIAQELHYKRIALAFGNDIGSQTFIQPAISALKKAGITMTTNQTLDLKATTFRSEAEAIIQSHPDAIMTEALGAADPTLFSEIKQLNGGKMIPVIGTSAAISPAFFKSAAAAVGSLRVRVRVPRGQPGRRVQRARLPGLLQGAAVPAGEGAGSHRRLHHLPERPGRGAPLRRDQPGRARHGHVEEHLAERLRPGHHQDRERGARRHGVLLVRPVRQPRSRPGRRSGTKGPAGRPTSTATTTRRASSRSIPTAAPAR